MSQDLAVFPQPNPSKFADLDGDILLFGSGSLSAAAVAALAVSDLPFRTVHVLARNERRVDELCAMGDAMSSLTRTKHKFQPGKFDYDSSLAPLSNMMRTVQPRAVLILAGRHLPRDNWKGPSGWSDFLERAGFGVTLPLQADVAVRVARAAGQACPEATLINACYPDVTNALMSMYCSNPILGVGNVMTVEASARSALFLGDELNVQLIGGYAGLQDDRVPIRIWVEGNPIDITKLQLVHRRSTPLDQRGIVAAGIVSVLSAMQGGSPNTFSMPGPLGLPGGYPIALTDGHLEFRMPSGIDMSEAVALNMVGLAADGIKRIDAGRVEFTEKTAGVLHSEPEMHCYAEGFQVEELHESAIALCKLRERMFVSPLETPDGYPSF